MNILTNITASSISNILLFILLISSNLYFALSRSKSDALTILKTENDTYRERINTLTAENAGFKSSLAEKEKRLSFLEDLFKNRNPELEIFIKTSNAAITSFQEYIKVDNARMEKILGVIEKYLTSNTKE